MNAHPPETSLIIPSRNRGRLLLETIHSILDGDEVPSEIVVIDQSKDPNKELIDLVLHSSCLLHYLWRPGAGVSKARNAGIRAARHEILAFVDDDVRVTPTWFGALIRALLESGTGAAVTGRVLPESQIEPGGFVPSTIDEPDSMTYEGRICTDVLYSNNMAFHRSIVNEVGDFDERLGSGTPYLNAEDNDFGFRLLEAGYRIIYRPEPTLYHRAWRSRSDYHPLCWSYGYGQGAYYAKHVSLRDRYTLSRLLSDLVQRSKRTLQFIRKDRHRATGQVVYMAGMVTGWCHWLISRPKLPSEAQRPRAVSSGQIT